MVPPRSDYVLVTFDLVQLLENSWEDFDANLCGNVSQLVL